MNEENNNENEPVMDSSIENIRHFIRQAESQLEAAKEMINVLALAEASRSVNQKETENKEWNPPWHKGFVICGSSSYEKEANTFDYIDGCIWPDHWAAKAQRKRDAFFRRLCMLAADLQGGEVGGNYEVFFNGGDWVPSVHCVGDIGGVFNSPDSVRKAAEIMNRDGWKMPEGLGGVK